MLKVKGEESGLKLSAFLKNHFPHLSGKAIKRAIDQRGCRIDGKLELFAKTPVVAGQEVEFLPPAKKETLPIRIIFEDDEMRVINKPPFVVCDSQLGLLVHRLDKETSGVMIVAKKSAAQNRLQDLFRQREVEKEYIAIVEGEFPKEPFTKESFLYQKCAYDGQKIWAEGEEGHYAVTRFSRLSFQDGLSLVLAQPVTGRTHQIRVQLAALGFPVLGDDHYSREKPFQTSAPRVMLHARHIAFAGHAFSAPIPEDFCAIIPDCQNISAR